MDQGVTEVNCERRPFANQLNANYSLETSQNMAPCLIFSRVEEHTSTECHPLTSIHLAQLVHQITSCSIGDSTDTATCASHLEDWWFLLNPTEIESCAHVHQAIPSNAHMQERFAETAVASTATAWLDSCKQTEHVLAIIRTPSADPMQYPRRNKHDSQ